VHAQGSAFQELLTQDQARDHFRATILEKS
jgi:hypothetical protein